MPRSDPADWRANNEDIIRKLLADDTEATTYWLQRLAAYFRSRFRSLREDAEDLANETLLAAVEQLYPLHRACFRGDSPFESWLFGIAWNMGAREVGRRGRRSKIAQFQSLDDQMESGWEPESEDDFAKRIEEATYWEWRLEELAPEERRVLDLWIYQDLPREKVAAELGLSLAATDSKFWRIIRKLRKWREDEGGLA